MPENELKPWPGLSILRLWVVLSLLKLMLAVLQLTYILDFHVFAFEDTGANLTIQYLMSQGLVPHVDFGYQYGLLPLLFGQAWFWVWGLSPYSCIGAMTFLTLMIVLALARFIAVMRIHWSGICLLACSLPHIGGVIYMNLCHPLEAVLLSHALVFHAKQERPMALALTSAALFAKPSMTYFYGLILLALILWEITQIPRHERGKALARRLQPAIITVIVLTAVLSAVYGWQSLFHSLFLLPIQGRAAYIFQRVGIFDLGGQFFLFPPGAKITYYLGTLAGFWMLASFILIAGGVAAIARLYRQGFRIRDETVAVYALLHVVFIFLLYAGPYSPSYYLYVLVMGLAAFLSVSMRGRYLLALLSVMAVLGFTASAKGSLNDWMTKIRSPRTAGLWAEPGLYAEWSHILRLAQTERAVLLSYAGFGEVLGKEFARPVSNFLQRGYTHQDDFARKNQQLAWASLIVEVNLGVFLTRAQPVHEWPEFAKALAAFEPAWEGRYFRVLRRRNDTELSRLGALRR